MRLKLTSLPPFPPVRVWLLIPQSVLTIQDLKTEIINNVIRHLHVQGITKRITSKQVVLSVDGFDLLDGTSVEVLKEGEDVVM